MIGPDTDYSKYTAELLDENDENCTVVVIKDPKGRPIVLMPLDQYLSLRELADGR